jgi:hypothetical protein
MSLGPGRASHDLSNMPGTESTDSVGKVAPTEPTDTKWPTGWLPAPEAQLVRRAVRFPEPLEERYSINITDLGGLARRQRAVISHSTYTCLHCLLLSRPGGSQGVRAALTLPD